MKEMFEKAIKARIEYNMERDYDTYGDWRRFLKGFEIVDYGFVKTTNTSRGQKREYKVITAYGKPEENNVLVEWDAFIFGDDTVRVCFNCYAE